MKGWILLPVNRAAIYYVTHSLWLCWTAQAFLSTVTVPHCNGETQRKLLKRARKSKRHKQYMQPGILLKALVGCNGSSLAGQFSHSSPPLTVRLLRDPSVVHGHLLYNPSIRPGSYPCAFAPTFLSIYLWGEKCPPRYHKRAAAQLQSCRPQNSLKPNPASSSWEVSYSLDLGARAQSSSSQVRVRR